MSKLTQQQLQAEAELRVRRALQCIQRAQNELGTACAELAALRGGVPVWKAASALYDRVHAYWYRVEAFRMARRYSLDDMNIEALERRLAAVSQSAPTNDQDCAPDACR